MQKFAFFPRRQNDRICSAPRELEQASLRARLGPGNSAAGEEVARQEVAAVAGVVGEHLRGRPVHVRQRSGAQAEWTESPLTHEHRPDVDLDVQVQPSLVSILVR